jgi:hypothetical protein
MTNESLADQARLYDEGFRRATWRLIPFLVFLFYQEGPLTDLRTPRDLIRKHTGTDTLPPGTAMFCGTPGTIGGIRPGTRFEMELENPVLGRTLRHAYDIDVLPVVS